MLVQIMHTIASALQTPVIVILLGLTLIMIAVLGMLIAELFTERRYFKLSLPALVEQLNMNPDYADVISQSGMLRRQKRVLLELLSHPEATESERESLAVNMVAEEQRLFDNRVKVTDLIAKVAPMLGLMGTLIPLGPGVVAIGEGNTALLSESLLIAFDTTVLGLIVGAVALLVSTIRKQWYTKYMSAFEAAAECVLGKANEEALLWASMPQDNLDSEEDAVLTPAEAAARARDTENSWMAQYGVESTRARRGVATAPSADSGKSATDMPQHAGKDIHIPRGPQQGA